ncbi:helix-turn-helix domain-containing protein [Desulfobotulus mexicanus]|uniref:helix-turn-helix domain-containing protein n=1 Tax=Desulfobotulus mexicanus TaxID=2586642 RepID=UPI001FE4605E|nr:DEAD/DEAH box helicase family protein [Desulfobotulus mexicanus]
MAKTPENFAETVKEVRQQLGLSQEELAHEPRWPNTGEKLIAKDRRIYVSTYPTMLNIIRDAFQHLSPHFFDFIVVDESHRSIYNTYKEVLDYFKTIILGLTATPTDIIDHNTFQLFHCEDGLPTFAYTFEEAVSNVPPYLCSFQVMKIQTRFHARNPETDTDRRQKWFMVPRADIETEGYELSLSRYKEDVFEEVKYEKPGVILERLLVAELGEDFVNHETHKKLLERIEGGIVRELLELREMIA